jgi:hypothetical protein
MQAIELHIANGTPVAGRIGLTACSLCLSVLRDGDWIDAADAIRELRSYDLPSPVALEPGICDSCRAALAERRASAEAA